MPAIVVDSLYLQERTQAWGKASDADEACWYLRFTMNMHAHTPTHSKRICT
jgi:hypothetical protein